jgi:hypothetical protein
MHMRLLRFVVTMALFTFFSTGCLDLTVPNRASGISVDAGTGDNKVDNPPPTPVDDPDGGTSTPSDPTCIKSAPATLDGNHNQGQACLNCHDGSQIAQGARKFVAGGTVFADATRSKGVGGVTVEITDGANKLTVVTSTTPGQEGNFYFEDVPLGSTYTVRASNCPSSRPMISKPNGNCNSSGCHDAKLPITFP